ncbi:hypothetical protein [Oceanispirochaeta sp. M2]|uniref:hypothetical protein n=1 Tax=Oceanispirochaeta sp. M2 TaxID=2735869 RepID=UPI001557F8F5|nr:hypothetical protein [Oceanispirochaeta sp. M2]
MRVCIRSNIILIIFFLMGVLYLRAEEIVETEEILESEEITFKTVYRDDHVFETRGIVYVRGDMDDLNTVLLDVHDYRHWILDGLTRRSVQSDELPALLVDVLVDPKNSDEIKIIYDLNRFLKFRGLSASFRTEWDYGASGVLRSLSFIYSGRKSYLREGRYTFNFTETAEGIGIEFVCEARLSGLLDLFFTVRIYDKNMSFYIRGLSGNLKKRLESDSQTP